MLDPQKLPNHIAIIPDGNGRWAQKRNRPRYFGHKAGIKSIRTAVKTCKELGIKYLTIYAFSNENWQRPVTELDAIFSLFKYFLKREVKKMIKQKIKLKFIGRLSRFSDDIKELIDESNQLMNFDPEMTVTVALNYGGRQEILDAVYEVIHSNISTINEENFSEFLYTEDIPDPDLIIRTSGEQRISNFLLWQSAYSEFYFADVLWPDFGKADLIKAVEIYQQRRRRFGGIKNE